MILPQRARTYKRPTLERSYLRLIKADDNTNYHQEPVSMSSMPDIRTRPAVTRKSLLK